MIKPTVEKDIVIRTETQGPVSMGFINNQPPSKQLNLPPQRELGLIYSISETSGIFDYTFDITFE
jgi:hypothetical protein